jgi:hypothetical protein
MFRLVFWSVFTLTYFVTLTGKNQVSTFDERIGSVTEMFVALPPYSRWPSQGLCPGWPAPYIVPRFSTLGLFYCPVDGGTIFLRNVGKLWDYAASHYRRQYSSSSPLAEPQISVIWVRVADMSQFTVVNVSKKPAGDCECVDKNCMLSHGTETFLSCAWRYNCCRIAETHSNALGCVLRLDYLHVIYFFSMSI